MSTDISLEDGLVDIPDNRSEEEILRVTKRIGDFYHKCLEDQKHASEPYQPCGEWRVYINERPALYQCLREEKYKEAAKYLLNFWRNEYGPIVKEYAHYKDLASGNKTAIDRYTTNVLRNYSIWKTLSGGRAVELEIPAIGNPWGIVIDGSLVAPKASRYHWHAVQIKELLVDVRNPVMLEIGAGYGGLSYYLTQLVPDICYIDCDLPETQVIAAYYLISCCKNREVVLYGEEPLDRLVTPRKGRTVLLPNFCLKDLKSASIDIVFNSFSLSEIPMETLLEYIVHIERVAKNYFLHNNMDRRGVVNRGHERIPSSDYPINRDRWKQIYKHFDIFHGSDGDYREFLFQRIHR